MSQAGLPASRPRLRVEQRDEALVVLVTGGAALEVGTHARERGVGLVPNEVELDKSIELLEALLAGQLLADWAQQTGKQGGGCCEFNASTATRE